MRQRVKGIVVNKKQESKFKRFKIKMNNANYNMIHDSLSSRIYLYIVYCFLCMYV